jgi:hypothetical protein
VRGIDNSGAVTGFFNSGYGFVRHVNGSYGKFDPEGSVQTVPVAIGRHGKIAGWYFDSTFHAHGFVRTP